jgi:hypothetical protein
MAEPKKRRNAKKTGPQPETLKIEGDWKAAVARALKRGKPISEAPKKKSRKRKG